MKVEPNNTWINKSSTHQICDYFKINYTPLSENVINKYKQLLQKLLFSKLKTHDATPSNIGIDNNGDYVLLDIGGSI